ncbi:MAG: ABC transporter ATP-binding protein [Rhodospirillaceae bacterium]|nr:ABC transporter ATP-binding protein [Rhodospirillaceae bacterium]
MTDAAPIRFTNVSKTFTKHDGTPFFACRELSFQVRTREIVAIVGETGCGKSTSFNLLLGLQKPDAGDVRVLGVDPFSSGEPLRGQVGIIFQNDRLLPWRTAVENIALGLEVLGVAEAEREATARRWLERVGLRGFDGAYPHELSGGMRQRVSIARAFAIGPRILYADEAFTALDELTAARIRRDLLELIRETAITTLFITHSVPEAVDIAQRILVFGRPGRVVGEVHRDRERAAGRSTEAIEALVREALERARQALAAEGTAADASRAPAPKNPG